LRRSGSPKTNNNKKKEQNPAENMNKINYIMFG
jgi:hypothetical protein